MNANVEQAPLTIEDTPENVLAQILRYLDEPDRIMLKRSSKRFYFFSHKVPYLYPNSHVLWHKKHEHKQVVFEDNIDVENYLISIPQSRFLGCYHNGRVLIIDTNDMQPKMRSSKVPEKFLCLFSVNQSLFGSIHLGKIYLWCTKTLDKVSEIEMPEDEGHVANNSRYIFTVSVGRISFYDTRLNQGPLLERHTLMDLEPTSFCCAADPVGDSHLCITKSSFSPRTGSSVEYLLLSISNPNNCVSICELPDDYLQAPVAKLPHSNDLYAFYNYTLHKLSEYENEFKEIYFLGNPDENSDTTCNYNHHLRPLDYEHFLIWSTKKTNSESKSQSISTLKIFSIKSQSVVKTLEPNNGFKDVRLSLFGRITTFQPHGNKLIANSYQFPKYYAEVVP